jgi:glycosyltransferase involved in cell wall biosynthesis
VSKAFVTPPSLSVRVKRRVATEWAKFSDIEQHRGRLAALRFLTARLTGFVNSRAGGVIRGLGRPEDLIALLPLPDLFIRHDVLFIGYIEGALGLGESLRGLVRSVAGTELRFALFPFKLGIERRLIGAFMEDRYDLRRRHRINVWEMSADQIPRAFREVGRWKTRHSYNILRTYWELPAAPAEWALKLAKIDEIWVPNTFVGEAFRPVFDGPINIIPPCVIVESDQAFERTHFGMGQGKFYFLFSFDYLSFPERKNPLGLVSAFRAAFPDLDENVGLVIKSTRAADQHLGFKAKLLRQTLGDPRIQMIDRFLSRDEMLSLLRQSDCYVSLHRSEGFGLGMAEAMALGKPVIGTDFSGSSDFLSDRTGFPVAFTLRAVQPGQYQFSDGQSWAEPDHAAAVEAMRSVFHDRAERECRAAAGKAFVEGRYGRDNVGRIAARRLKDILSLKHRAA